MIVLELFILGIVLGVDFLAGLLEVIIRYRDGHSRIGSIGMVVLELVIQSDGHSRNSSRDGCTVLEAIILGMVIGHSRKNSFRVGHST